MPPRRGSGSGVLDGQLGNPPEDRPPGYAADLSTMHRLISRGPRNAREGMRLGRLKVEPRWLSPSLSRPRVPTGLLRAAPATHIEAKAISTAMCRAGPEEPQHPNPGQAALRIGASVVEDRQVEPAERSGSAMMPIFTILPRD